MICQSQQLWTSVYWRKKEIRTPPQVGTITENPHNKKGFQGKMEPEVKPTLTPTPGESRGSCLHTGQNSEGKPHPEIYFLTANGPRKDFYLKFTSCGWAKRTLCGEFSKVFPDWQCSYSCDNKDKSSLEGAPIFVALKNYHLLFCKGNEKHTWKIIKGPRKWGFMNKNSSDNRK